MIIDSHAHLDMPQFDSDRDAVISRARDAGLQAIITIATAAPANDSVEKTLALAEQHGFIWAGIGVHPHDARLPDERYWEKLEEWAKHPKVVLWGEIGLDYYYDHSPREVQRQVFRRQLRTAHRLALPVSIHCRDAWPDLMAIVREECRDSAPGGIVHSFTGGPAEAAECTSNGFLVSFSGIATFKNAAVVRVAAAALRDDQVLVETDSPYLAPVPHRGKRNEPAFVVDVARSVADTKKVSFEDLARSTTANLRQLIRAKL